MASCLPLPELPFDVWQHLVHNFLDGKASRRLAFMKYTNIFVLHAVGFPNSVLRPTFQIPGFSLEFGNLTVKER